MHATILKIDSDQFSLDKTELYRHIAPGSQEADQHTANLTDQLLNQCLDIVKPEAALVYRAPVKAPLKTQVAVQDQVFETGGTIAKMLRGSEEYAFFIATTGPELENLSRSLLDSGEYLEGYIVDVIASSLTEQVAEQVHQEVRDKAESQGRSVSNRYSPGYCGWKVNEQQKLFALFPAGFCGITLSDSSLMHPIKSISAVIGAGTEVRYRDYTCELCSMTHCVYRKTRSDHPSVNPANP